MFDSLHWLNVIVAKLCTTVFFHKPFDTDKYFNFSFRDMLLHMLVTFILCYVAYQENFIHSCFTQTLSKYFGHRWFES